MTDIIPAVLPTSYDDLVERLGSVKGATTNVQIDICDGAFVPSRTWPLNPSDRAHFAEIVKGDEGLPYWEDFNFEVDLMVHNPEKFLSTWIAAGVTRAVIHQRSHHDWAAIHDAAGETLELGLGIDLSVDIEKIHTYITHVQYLQIMGIAQLGVQGEPLDERVYDLIKKVRAEFPDVTIQIDGGVSLDTAPDLLDAGADRLVVGSKVMFADNPKQALKEFQSL
jgi:ribulose-phosphate 3-epimerase